MNMKKVLSDFKTSGGKHCITTALKQVFDYYGYVLSEEMIFGLGAGLSFCYINLEKSPMVSGRIKVFEFEEILSQRLNVQIKCKKSKDYDVACKKTKQLLDADKPVLIYVDMPYLDYLNLDKNSHFGGHAVVVIGYDDDNQKFYISDRDNSNYEIRTPVGYIHEDYHLVDYDEVRRARNSDFKPFPAHNKYLDIEIINPNPITKSLIFSAIDETCQNMLNAPAQLLGLNGIMKFSKEVLKWSKFDDVKLRNAAITNYFQISGDGGTGGGIFRKMYGEFLVESSQLISVNEFYDIGNEYIDIASKWDHISTLFWQLSEDLNRDLLKDISKRIRDLHDQEMNALIRLYEIVK